MKKWLDKFPCKKPLPLLFLLLAAAAGVLLLLPGPSSTAMTAEEMRISRTLSAIDGAGETRISIHYAAASYGSNQPVGAVIVSRGAGNMAVKLRLMQAAETLLGLNGGCVAVFEMEETP